MAQRMRDGTLRRSGAELGGGYSFVLTVVVLDFILVCRLFVFHILALAHDGSQI